MLKIGDSGGNQWFISMDSEGANRSSQIRKKDRKHFRKPTIDNKFGQDLFY